MERGGEEEEGGGLALARRQHETPDRGEAQARVGIGNDAGKARGLEGLFHRPQYRLRLAQGNGEELVARQPQRLKPMAMEPSPLTALQRQAAP